MHSAVTDVWLRHWKGKFWFRRWQNVWSKFMKCAFCRIQVLLPHISALLLSNFVATDVYALSIIFLKSLPADFFPFLVWAKFWVPVLTEGKKFLISSWSMRLTGRNSQSRLEAWDWREEILDLVSKHETDRQKFSISSRSMRLKGRNSRSRLESWKMDLAMLWLSLPGASLLLGEIPKVNAPYGPPGTRKQPKQPVSGGRREKSNWRLRPPRNFGHFTPWNHLDWWKNGPFFGENQFSPANEAVLMGLVVRKCHFDVTACAEVLRLGELMLEFMIDNL